MHPAWRGVDSEKGSLFHTKYCAFAPRDKSVGASNIHPRLGVLSLLTTRGVALTQRREACSTQNTVRLLPRTSQLALPTSILDSRTLVLSLLTTKRRATPSVKQCQPTCTSFALVTRPIGRLLIIARTWILRTEINQKPVSSSSGARVGATQGRQQPGLIVI